MRVWRLVRVEEPRKEVGDLAKIVSAYSKKEPEWEKPKDWPFMEQSGEVLDMIPETWRQYPDDVPGRMNIISMEYKELQEAKTREQKMHELVHLGSACLYLWRKLAHVE